VTQWLVIYDTDLCQPEMESIIPRYDKYLNYVEDQIEKWWNGSRDRARINKPEFINCECVFLQGFLHRILLYVTSETVGSG
jgi:hypothetical protein